MMSLQSATADAHSARAKVKQLQAEASAFQSALADKEQKRVVAQERAQVLSADTCHTAGLH